MDNGRRLANGHLVVPSRIEAPDGAVGEGMVELAPDDPGYAVWDAYLPNGPTSEPRGFDSADRPTS